MASSYFLRRTALWQGSLPLLATAAVAFVHEPPRSSTTERRVETISSLLLSLSPRVTTTTTRCDGLVPPSPMRESTTETSSTNNRGVEIDTTLKKIFHEGMQSNVPDETSDNDYYSGLFPIRQLWMPKVPYPLWDSNWDHRQPTLTGDRSVDHQIQRQIRKTGVTRHIILVRHGQYDETYKEDEKRILTPLGIEQAHMTGKRLAEMMAGVANDPRFGGPCRIRAIRVSGLTRARETATIIASYLPDIPLEEMDPMLNEGRPCHTIPGGPVSKKEIDMTDAHHPRIEGAYRKYFYRAPTTTILPAAAIDDKSSSHNNNSALVSTKNQQEEEKHEFEIIVCHANVIRYFLCRALQLPPEAWLRYCPFNCSLTYITIRPTGTVSCRMVGDIGHLPYHASTFSGHYGYNW